MRAHSATAAAACTAVGGGAYAAVGGFAESAGFAAGCGFYSWFYRGFYRGGERPFPRKGKVREGGEYRSPARERFYSRFYSSARKVPAAKLNFLQNVE